MPHTSRTVHFLAIVTDLLQNVNRRPRAGSRTHWSASDLNNDEAVADAASEAIARWLHYQYSLRLPSGIYGVILFCHVMPSLFSIAF